MHPWGRTARRLTAATLLALALLAAGVVAPTPGPGAGGGGWGQPGAPDSAFGYAAPSGGVTRPLLGVVGYKPAVVARLDPRTLRAVPGPRIELPYGVSGYAWSPDRSRLVLGDLDDDALHVVDPLRLRRLATIRFGIVAEAPQQLAWLGPRRLAVVAGSPSDGATLVMADPVAGRVLSRQPLAPAGIVAADAGHRLVLVHSEAHLNGDLLYASVDNGGGQPGRVVVSLGSGQVVASSDELLPYLLDDPGPAR